MAETEQNNTNKVQIAARIDLEIFNILEGICVDEERPLSRVIERLLKTHPKIEPLLIKGESAEAAV